MLGDSERKENKWSEKTLRTFVQWKVDALESVRDDGLKDPIIIQREGMKLCDGGHRLSMLEALGSKTVIVREVC